MTHSVNGNIIIADEKAVKYNYELANNIIVKYLKKFGEYFSHFDNFSGVKITKYWWAHDDSLKEQPFINVFDKPLIFKEWASNINKKSLPPYVSRPRLIVKIESGSHVGFNNIEEAMEIYDTSREILIQLEKEEKRLVGDREILLVMDNEDKFFTPRDFLREIKSSHS